MTDAETDAPPADPGTAAFPRPGLPALLGAWLAVAAVAGAARLWLPDWADPAAAAAMLLLPLALWPRPEGMLRPEARRTAPGLLEGLACGLVLVPLFLAGARLAGRFNSGGPEAGVLARAALYQAAAVAVPEEFFFRAFLQRGLESRGGRCFRLAGARLGWGWPAAAALFALAHLVSSGQPAQLLVFFPGLVFGWLWARRESIAGPVVFHVMCNLSLLWTEGLF
jgi:membrane protease YdiL (CAAX protease family)